MGSVECRDPIPNENTSMPKSQNLDSLRKQLAQFAAERDWDQFHNPKNLAIAVAGEAGELVDHFRWLTFEQATALPRAGREAVALECADVLLFLIRLCDKASKKLAINAKKYPIAKSHGRAVKYDKL
jgi:dCTP diphosphatase